jgi:hypothetical protein
MPLPGRNRPRFNKPTEASQPAEPQAAPPPPPPTTPAPPAQDFRKPIYRKRKVIRTQSSSGMDPSTMRYIIFFLIFVVGNAILFFTTGWVIIPK